MRVIIASNKRRSNDLVRLSSSESYARSLQRAVLFQSLEKKSLNCTGTAYSYGTWGTFSADCH
jgi:hypothetical protein